MMSAGGLAMAIVDLAAGEHLCLVFDDLDEQCALVAPYIRRGLVRGDRGIYVAADRTVGDATGLLAGAGIDVEQQSATDRSPTR
jgi:hypothetical protein